MLDDGAPLFSQIADLLSEEIADGVLIEGDRVPSTNELAAYHRINPRLRPGAQYVDRRRAP